MPKLYSAFQDKKSIKNALSIFAVVAFEQVVTKYGINCRNALLWLIVPPCVIFGITLIKSKNVRFLFNRRTSKTRCLSPRIFGEGVAAILYMIMPSIAWVIAAFLNSKIWVCYRAGYDECGVVKLCSKDEEFAYHIIERDAKSKAQNLGLLMLSGAVVSLAVVTWGNHLLCARPLKEVELNELVREASRSELERFVMSRAKEKLSAVGQVLTAFKQKKEEESERKLEENCNKENKKDEETAQQKDSTEKNKNTADNNTKDSDDTRKYLAWLETVDYKIDVFLDEYLSLNDVKMVYPEV